MILMEITAKLPSMSFLSEMLWHNSPLLEDPCRYIACPCTTLFAWGYVGGSGYFIVFSYKHKRAFLLDPLQDDPDIEVLRREVEQFLEELV